jgi:hypothetical protein
MRLVKFAENHMIVQPSSPPKAPRSCIMSAPGPLHEQASIPTGTHKALWQVPHDLARRSSQVLHLAH